MGSATLVAVKWRRNRRARNCKVSQLFESSLWRGVGESRNRWGHERIPPPPPFLSKFAVVYRLDHGGRCLGWKNNGSWMGKAPWLRCTEIWLCSRTDLRLELCAMWKVLGKIRERAGTPVWRSTGYDLVGDFFMISLRWRVRWNKFYWIFRWLLLQFWTVILELYK